MDIFEAVTCVAFVMVATTLVALVIERRMDVLHGPYLEGRKGPSHPLLSARFQAIARLAEQLRWKARNIVYVTSLVPC
jgi:hypothetical protein